MKHQILQTTPEISNRMSKVKLKRNNTEILLAKELWKRGFRYHLNDKSLPGSPDIAITKFKIAIFVDGEFWHGKDWEIRKTKLKSNTDYWIEKIEENIARDIKNNHLLNEMGWTPLHFWENTINNDIDYCIKTILDFIDIYEKGMDLNDY